MICTICDLEIDKDTVPLEQFGGPIHPICEIPEEVLVCKNMSCMWWQCSHAGLCVT